jgi:hypothetical protein
MPFKSAFDSLKNTAYRNASGYANGVVRGKISDLIGQLTSKVPTEFLGIATSLLQASDIDPLQNIMFSVRIMGIEIPDHMIQSITLPHYTMEYRTQRQGGRMQYYIKSLDLSELVIKFTEDRDVRIMSIFDQMTTKAFAPVDSSLEFDVQNSDAGAASGTGVSASDSPSGGTYGSPADYKMDIKVDILSGPDSASVMSIWYYECVAIGITPYQMDAMGGVFIQPSITFKPHEVKVKPAGNGETSGGFVNSLTNSVKRTVMGSVKSYVGY